MMQKAWIPVVIALIASIAANAFSILAGITPWSMSKEAFFSPSNVMDCQPQIQQGIGYTRDVKYGLVESFYLVEARCTIDGGFVSQKCYDIYDRTVLCSDVYAAANFSRHFCEATARAFCGESFNRTKSGTFRLPLVSLTDCNEAHPVTMVLVLCSILLGGLTLATWIPIQAKLIVYRPFVMFNLALPFVACLSSFIAIIAFLPTLPDEYTYTKGPAYCTVDAFLYAVVAAMQCWCNYIRVHKTPKPKNVPMDDFSSLRH